MINRVFYKPVENTPQKFLLFSPPPPPPPPPLGISIDHLWGGGGYGYFLESHIVQFKGILTLRPGFEIYFYVQLPLGQPQDSVWLPREYFGCPSSCLSSSQETNTGS